MLTAIILSAAMAAIAPPTEQPRAACRVLLTAKHTGDPVFSEDAAPAICPEQLPQPTLRYDPKSNLILAREDLAEGSQLGLAYLPDRPAVAAGENVQITARIGHVEVSRTVVALQSADAGQRFFARSADGTVFVAPPVGRNPKQGDNRQ